MTPRCRFCASTGLETLVDLGRQPLANSYLRPEQLDRPEPRYPLHARVCPRCLLVQVDDVVPADHIFSDDYAYFSSYSTSWLEHCERFAGWATESFQLTPSSKVVEVASNDGYLLDFFQRRGIGILGVEPSSNVAEVAVAKGIPTRVAFFGTALARALVDEGHRADLVVANNVMAHVPDLNDFVAGFRELLAPGGVVSVEVQHLRNLVNRVQFDTIYHEHYSYYTLVAAEAVFTAHGLRVFDVHQLPTHGGSLRFLAVHADDPRPDGHGLGVVRDLERAEGFHDLSLYRGFGAKVDAVRDGFLAYLTDARAAGRTVAGYGAAAKASTFLNHAGVTPDDVAFVTDLSEHKQGRAMPGTHIPIVSPDELRARRPDDILILVWNIEAEVREQLADAKTWEARFVTALPELRITSA